MNIRRSHQLKPNLYQNDKNTNIWAKKAEKCQCIGAKQLK